MTTAVASPHSLQQLPGLGWNGGSGRTGGFSAMSSDDVSRMFVAPRKAVHRSNSSSSLASSSSTASTSTITETSSTNGETSAVKKKARGGFWPVTTKAESTSVLSNARANGAVQPTAGTAANSMSGKVQPALPTQSQQNGRTPTQANNDASALLALLPMNGTFERKQINVPFWPDVLKVGRQTNAKTVPTPVNGYFDSKVLSRQHAEVWAERNGKVFIKDVKSSNGTFVNGQRLSPENRESEPHELRQHDTLELGIDIVSEDQKTIVHHKVSAKVEYVGLPNTSHNVLDLNFGDLDPSNGGSLMASPISSPMAHSRSRPAGPVVNGRGSAASSVAGSQVTSVAQQRQLNFWGAPLNVEQLVKHLSTEMRAARLQQQELEQASSFLSAVLNPEGQLKPQPANNKEAGQLRMPNGKHKTSKTDQATRFAEPPAPPPQQPLPEKPDATSNSPISPTAFPTHLLKRADTAKPLINGASTTNAPPSQMLSLLEALSVTKKELDSQGQRVKELEEMLKQEKEAREDAEERARRLEQSASSRVINNVEEVKDANEEIPVESKSDTKEEQPPPTSMEKDLQQRLDQVVADMQRMKNDMVQFQQRAEQAENDAANARTSLAEMIEKIRAENEAAEMKKKSEAVPKKSRNVDDPKERVEDDDSHASKSLVKQDSKQANGHVRAPTKLPQHVERAVTTLLRDQHNGNGEALAQSAPYVSMLGVVLIGVGLMAYLNSWQKAER